MYKQDRFAPKQLTALTACKHVVFVIHCSPNLQQHLEKGLTNLMHMHYTMCKRRPTAYKFLHTHSVLLRLPLTTADEKLSKVTAPW